MIRPTFALFALVTSLSAHGIGEVPANSAAHCALSAAEYALQALDYAYNLDVLSECLFGTERFATVGSLAKTLKSHCLSVSPRRSLSGRDICRYVGQSPAHFVFRCKSPPPPAVGHVYVIAAMGSGVAVFDPAAGLTTYEMQVFEKSFDAEESRNDIFLLVSPLLESRPSLRSDIATSPDMLDFGEIAAEDKPEKKAAILNSSQKSLAVARVVAACGCMDVKLSTGLISAGGSAEVSVTVRGDLWGYASKRKDIQIRFADGSFAVLPVLASLKSANELNPTPRSIVFGSITNNEPRHVTIDRLTLEETLGDWVVESSVDWLRTSCAVRGKEKAPFSTGSLLVSISCEIEGWRLADAGKLCGVVSVRSARSGRSTDIPVDVVHEQAFYSQPGYLYLGAGREPIAVRIKRKSAGAPFRVARVESATAIVTYQDTWQSEELELTAVLAPGMGAAASGSTVIVWIEVERRPEMCPLPIPVVCP